MNRTSLGPTFRVSVWREWSTGDWQMVLVQDTASGPVAYALSPVAFQEGGAPPADATINLGQNPEAVTGAFITGMRRAGILPDGEQREIRRLEEHRADLQMMLGLRNKPGE